jgi:hypothetical protein
MVSKLSLSDFGGFISRFGQINQVEPREIRFYSKHYLPAADGGTITAKGAKSAKPESVVASSSQGKRCKELRPLKSSPTTNFSSADCPSQDCANTVQISGICVATTAIGNLVYGLVMGYLYFSLPAALTFAGIVNQGPQTPANKLAVQLGWQWGSNPGYVGGLAAFVAGAPLLGQNAPQKCKACPEAVNAFNNHVKLSRVAPGTPPTVGLPKNVN